MACNDKQQSVDSVTRLWTFQSAACARKNISMKCELSAILHPLLSYEVK